MGPNESKIKRTGTKTSSSQRSKNNQQALSKGEGSENATGGKTPTNEPKKKQVWWKEGGKEGQDTGEPTMNASGKDEQVWWTKGKKNDQNPNP